MSSGTLHDRHRHRRLVVWFYGAFAVLWGLAPLIMLCCPVAVVWNNLCEAHFCACATLSESGMYVYHMRIGVQLSLVYGTLLSHRDRCRGRRNSSCILRSTILICSFWVVHVHGLIPAVPQGWNNHVSPCKIMWCVCSPIGNDNGDHA